MNIKKQGLLAVLLMGILAARAWGCDSGLGLNADLHGNRLFPSDSPWNQAIDKKTVDPNSTVMIKQLGSGVSLHPDFGANAYWADGKPFGIPYRVVSGTTPKVPISFTYSSESDPGPYPFPSDAPIEGGSNSTGDRHVIILDQDHWKLYETWSSYPQADGSWQAGSGAVFNLTSTALRPAGWTSADAAGLPILPGLVRYDEVYLHKAINHAIRFTVAQTRKAYIAPARHFASSNTSPSLLPMGARLRLKANYDISGFSAPAQVILKALKKYGIIVADNGSNMYISGTADSRWDDDVLNTLKQVKNTDFEVVTMGPLTTQ